MALPLSKGLIEERPDSPANISGFAFVLGLVGFLVGTGCGIQSSNPARFNDVWVFVWIVCIGASAVALSGRLQKNSRPNRIVCSIALGLALLGAWCPTASYYGNYHTYPWLFVVPLALLSTVGGLMCGLRVVPLMSCAFLAVWFVPAFFSPTVALPSVRRVDGLECTLYPMSDGRFLEFQIRDTAGNDIPRDFDPAGIDIKGSVGPLIPLRCDSAQPDPTFEDVDIPTGASVKFHSWVHRPEWGRSLSLQIIVHRRSKSAAALLDIPLFKLPGKMVSTNNGNYSLSVENVRWGKSRSQWPQVKCLQMTVGYAGFKYSGTTGKEVGVFDNLGNRIEASSNSTSGSDTGSTEDFDLGSINPKASSIRVELYDEARFAKEQTIFDFGRISAW